MINKKSWFIIKIYTLFKLDNLNIFIYYISNKHNKTKVKGSGIDSFGNIYDGIRISSDSNCPC